MNLKLMPTGHGLSLHSVIERPFARDAAVLMDRVFRCRKPIQLVARGMLG